MKIWKKKCIYACWQGNSEHTLFIKHDGEKISIMLIYVDDMMITDDDESEITRLKKRFLVESDLKDLRLSGCEIC